MKKEFEENPEVVEDEVENTPSATFDGDEPGGEEPGEDDPNYYEEEGEGGEGGENNDPPADDPTDPPADDPTDPPADDPVDPPADDDDDDDDDYSGDDDDDDEPSGIPLGQRDDDDTAGGTKKVNSYSVSITNGETTKKFSVSLQDKIEALYTLVNDTYAEADGCYYDCIVYDEDKYLIMSSWWSGDAYKQSYKVKKDVYSLVGDRVRVKAVWCTEDEEKALDNMRANYSAISEKLAKYESEPEKKEIFESSDWDNIRETDAFIELSKEENHFDYSVDELSETLNKMLLEYSKHNKIEFSAKEDPKKSVGVKIFRNPTDKKSSGKGRYGGIFSK